MIEPLQLSFTVKCSRDLAFDLWTRRTNSWWPKDHTLTGTADVDVNIEPFVGGRIFERSSEGTLHHWGTVTNWEPPRRFAYEWFIAGDASDASLVEIDFRDVDDGTRIEINHSGWERLGRGPRLRALNERGWSGILPSFIAACDTLPARSRSHRAR